MDRTAGTGLTGGTTGTWNPNNDMMNPPRTQVPPAGRVRALGKNQGASESGIIDSTRIDPLNRKSEGAHSSQYRRCLFIVPNGASSNWTRTAQDATSTAASTAQTAAASATGAAKFAYGHLAGNQELKNQGSEQLWGKQ
ncbi:hypothetical protein AURDEDRAFT_162440 [Auricularia subglabra TFB-10046 SS5]|nr:hypothetical protein AURDEDRAFT_162440 [Auricularia subglabra TFB-10046 SS5]